MTDHRKWEGQFEEQSSRHENGHGAHRERQVLPDDRCGATRQSMRVRKPSHVFRQKRHIGCLERDVGARSTHGDPDIGAGQRGGVIDPVADEGNLASVSAMLRY